MNEQDPIRRWSKSLPARIGEVARQQLEQVMNEVRRAHREALSREAGGQTKPNRTMKLEFPGISITLKEIQGFGRDGNLGGTLPETEARDGLKSIERGLADEGLGRRQAQEFAFRALCAAEIPLPTPDQADSSRPRGRRPAPQKLEHIVRTYSRARGIVKGLLQSRLQGDELTSAVAGTVNSFREPTGLNSLSEKELHSLQRSIRNSPYQQDPETLANTITHLALGVSSRYVRRVLQDWATVAADRRANPALRHFDRAVRTGQYREPFSGWPAAVRAAKYTY